MTKWAPITPRFISEYGDVRIFFPNYVLLLAVKQMKKNLFLVVRIIIKKFLR